MINFSLLTARRQQILLTDEVSIILGKTYIAIGFVVYLIIELFYWYHLLTVKSSCKLNIFALNLMILSYTDINNKYQRNLRA